MSGQLVTMPVSVDLLSPAGPKNAGQSSPALRVPRLGTESALTAIRSESSAARACRQANAIREVEINNLSIAGEPRRENCTLGLYYNHACRRYLPTRPVGRTRHQLKAPDSARGVRVY